MIKDLRRENDILADEASSLRNENEDVLKRMKQLERVKKRQNEKLKEAQAQLGECKLALASLETEMRRNDEQKSSEIQDLISRLDCKSEEIEQLMADKDYLILQVQSLNLKVDDMEESHDRLKSQSNKKIQKLENKLDDAQTDLQQQIKDLASTIVQANSARQMTKSSEQPKRQKSVPIQHDHGHVMPPTSLETLGKSTKRLPSRKKTSLSLKKGIPELSEAMSDVTSVRGDTTDRSNVSNPLPPIQKELQLNKKPTTGKPSVKKASAKVRK